LFLSELFCLSPIHHIHLRITVCFTSSWLIFWILIVQICLIWHVNLQDWKTSWKADSGITSRNLFYKTLIKTFKQSIHTHTTHFYCIYEEFCYDNSSMLSNINMHCTEIDVKVWTGVICHKMDSRYGLLWTWNSEKQNI
jgi:hypothetical protein